MQSQQVNTLELGGIAPWNVHVSQQGQTIIRGTKDYKIDTILSFDLNELLSLENKHSAKLCI